MASDCIKCWACAYYKRSLAWPFRHCRHYDKQSREWAFVATGPNGDLCNGDFLQPAVDCSHFKRG